MQTSQILLQCLCFILHSVLATITGLVTHMATMIQLGDLTAYLVKTIGVLRIIFSQEPDLT